MSGISTSIHCHDFVSKDFWLSCREDMINVYIPGSETLVAKYDNKIIGFISLVEDTLAAIFVLPDFQRKGIGKNYYMKLFQEKKSHSSSLFKK